MKRHEQQHYCRHCTVSFEPTPGKTPSAHMSYVLHLTHHHPDHALTAEGDPKKLLMICTRYCDGHEQADEKQHGVKLYGPGSTRISEVVPILLTAEEVWGPDDE